jgi:hypothetical protein
MKIVHNAALNFHPIFIPFNQLFVPILDFGFWHPPYRGYRRLGPEADIRIQKSPASISALAATSQGQSQSI